MTSVRVSFLFFRRLANQRGVAGFRIDYGARGLTTASHGVGILLLGDHTVFDNLGGGWRQLASDRRRGGRNRRLFRRAAGQKQAKHQPSFPHALFSLSRARLSMAILVTHQESQFTG